MPNFGPGPCKHKSNKNHKKNEKYNNIKIQMSIAAQFTVQLQKLWPNY
ncbi:hypothetical protein F383_04341 [Gossypium arboreum]|uniref:Uncharacterized protein n=1 Tax=Gossypium arboreum TaxID=29729 RepID=A0A0B0PEN1_GOSAR|nr:hypothetical protein F383_23857 [Gossypium arboreum]KHG21846.1 hypothetical protein F383_04341 [Gossypium arboreum]